MKKLLGGATLGAVVLQLLFGVLASLFIVPPMVSAATSKEGTVVNRSLIMVNNVPYFDDTMDENFSYKGPKNGNCRDYLDGFSNFRKKVSGGSATYVDANLSKGATLHTFTQSTTNTDSSGCKETKTPVTFNFAADIQTEKFDTAFVWINNSQIVASDGSSIFNRTDASQSYLEAGGDHCKDSITGKPGDSFVNLTVRSDGTNTSYDNDAWPFVLGNGKNIDGCNNTYPTLRVAVDSSFIVDSSCHPAPYPSAPPACTAGKGDGAGTTVNTSTSSTSDPCGGHINAFAYIFCPIINGIDGLIKAAFSPPGPDGGGGWAYNELTTSPLDNGDQIKAVWTVMRNLTNVFFVVIFLLAVFANTLSIDIDAYTVKKVLPRLVAAVFLVQFSYVICSLVIDLTNILAAGIPSLINLNLIHGEGTTGIQKVMSSLAGIAILGSGVAAITLLSAWVLLIPVALSLLIGVLSVIFTLVLRHFIINVLIVMSPFAFAAMVLPNTEKLYKLWWTNFTKILLMFPLIILLLTLASIFTLTKKGDLLALLSPIIVFFMIPATFKASGSLMAAGTSAVRGRAGGLQKRATQGEFAKGLRSGVREKNLLQAQSAKTVFGRAGARFQAAGVGGLLGTRTANRQLAAGRAKVLDERGKEYTEEYTNAKYTPGQLAAIGSGGTYTNTDGETFEVPKGVKIDDASKAAAISMLATKQSWGDLRSMRNAAPADSPERKLIENTLKKQGDVWKAAPDIVNDKAFQNLSAEKITNFDPSTIKALGTYIGSTPAPADAADHAKVKSATFSLLTTIADTPARRSTVTTKVGSEINAMADVAYGPGSAEATAIKSHYMPNGTVVP